LIVVPKPMRAALRCYCILLPSQLPAAPLDVRRSYLIVVPRPSPAAPLIIRQRCLV
jgi:hypothetical protein